MRVVIQRVSSAKVSFNDETRSVGNGYLIMLGIAESDSEEDMDKLIYKIKTLKLFEDGEGHFAKDIKQIKGQILLISQFTLFAEVKKGTKPYFGRAMNPKDAVEFYNEFIDKLKQEISEDKIVTGEFGAYMKVDIQNDGPVTIIIDSRDL